MHLKHILAAGGAIAAVVLVPAAAPAASGRTVTVRVEAPSRTLLAPTVTHTHTGSVTKGGAPNGACPATSAAGALDTATHHRWSAKWSSSFNDYFISSILGTAESGTTYYWGIWINNRFATTGACEISLHTGDQLLFAADSVAHHEHPLALRAPRKASAGHGFSAQVVWFSDSGAAKPLAGARVSGAGAVLLTDSHGRVNIVPSRTGMLTLRAAKSGYIQAAATRVRVG